MRVPYILVVGVIAGAATAAIGWDTSANSPPASTLEPAPPASSHATEASSNVSGRVIEHIEVERYSYLRLEVAGSVERWVAVPRGQFTAGQTVRVVDAMLMRSFTSKQLGRTFDTIYFGTVAAGGKSPAGADVPGDPHGHGSGPGGQVADVPVTDVARASGPRGRTVAEVLSQAKALDGSPVRIRAVVVKLTQAVLDRNWLHVQDGSKIADGTPADLVVTTPANVVRGQTIVLDGLVRTDRDLGSGYRYAVLVEDAAIEQEAP